MDIIGLIMLFVLGILIFSVSIGIPAYFIFFKIKKLMAKDKNFEKRKELSTLIDLFVTIIIPFFSFTGIWSNANFDERLREEAIGTVYHTPISREHFLTILLLFSFPIVAFWILKLFKSNMSPIFKVLTTVLIIQGIIVNMFLFIQFSAGFQHIIAESNAFDFFLASISIYFYLYPVHIIIIFITELLTSYNYFIEQEKNSYKVYKNRIIQKLYANLINNNWYTNPVLAIMLIPIGIVEMLILTLFGQKPDSFVQAFIKTCDWTFSKCQPLPNIPYSGHYLCTVAAKGHKGLVKPLRNGIRGGSIIRVNRQLLVANAFEELLEQYFPKVHHFVRKNYDRFGIPIYKCIGNIWIADVVYIIMKPLEWLFLICLYTMDKNPENRIALQYTNYKHKQRELKDYEEKGASV